MGKQADYGHRLTEADRFEIQRRVAAGETFASAVLCSCAVRGGSGDHRRHRRQLFVHQFESVPAPTVPLPRSNAASCVHRVSVLSFFTAMAMAHFVPTRTTSFRARVMPV